MYDSFFPLVLEIMFLYFLKKETAAPKDDSYKD